MTVTVEYETILPSDAEVKRTLVTGGDPYALLDMVPDKEDFEVEVEGELSADPDADPPTETLDYLPAPEAERLALACIRSFAEFESLAPVKLACYWKREGGTEMGAAKLAALVKPTGLLKQLAEVDYVIWLAADHLRDVLWPMWKLEALLHHQLSHAKVTTKFNKRTRKTTTRCGIRAHGFEGFRAEAERYRDWNRGLETARHAFDAFDTRQQQLTLFPIVVNGEER